MSLSLFWTGEKRIMIREQEKNKRKVKHKKPSIFLSYSFQGVVVVFAVPRNKKEIVILRIRDELCQNKQEKKRKLWMRISEKLKRRLHMEDVVCEEEY
jgi:hypothetical protein